MSTHTQRDSTRHDRVRDRETETGTQSTDRHRYRQRFSSDER